MTALTRSTVHGTAVVSRYPAPDALLLVRRHLDRSPFEIPLLTEPLALNVIDGELDCIPEWTCDVREIGLFLKKLSGDHSVIRLIDFLCAIMENIPLSLLNNILLSDKMKGTFQAFLSHILRISIHIHLH